VRCTIISATIISATIISATIISATIISATIISATIISATIISATIISVASASVALAAPVSAGLVIAARVAAARVAAARGRAELLRVGLTGGIGAGKSEVSRRLAAQGAVVIDADAIARTVVEPGTAGLADVVAAFGPDVLLPDGRLDRPRLGDIVFADPQLRAKLSGIVHPLVAARTRTLEEAAGPGAIVVHDVPLIAENSLAASYDLVVVVDVPPRIQLDRLVRHRGLSREQAKARMAAQASRAERLAIAGIVIDNSGSLAELDRLTGELWTELRRSVQLSRDG
jgi:dephospho-CoA kinase